jgi:hypothetical protein
MSEPGPNESRIRTTSLRARKLLQLALLPPTVIAFVVIVVAWKFPDLVPAEIPESVIYIVGFGVVALYFLVTLMAWRCPECGAYLGRELHPACCPRCGVSFTDGGERG